LFQVGSAPRLAQASGSSRTGRQSIRSSARFLCFGTEIDFLAQRNLNLLRQFVFFFAGLDGLGQLLSLV
jgi:hypothetical protein